MPWQIRRPPERALWTFPGSGMRPLDARDTARQSVSCVSRDARNAITTLQSSANQGGRHERSRAQGRLFLRAGAQYGWTGRESAGGPRRAGRESARVFRLPKRRQGPARSRAREERNPQARGEKTQAQALQEEERFPVAGRRPCRRDDQDAQHARRSQDQRDSDGRRRRRRKVRGDFLGEAQEGRQGSQAVARALTQARAAWSAARARATAPTSLCASRVPTTSP